MPESVKDRPTRAHEYLFMFTKSDQYLYDRGAIIDPNGRNKRSIWDINTVAYAGAHFATFPPKLVEPCIKASTRPGDFVLDPFFGSGTAGLVANELGRRYVGIELNPGYIALGERSAWPRLRACRHNIHNRVGEAEKSHQKARVAGFTECWTIVNVDRTDLDQARRERPSTNRFYRLSDLLDQASDGYRDFHDRIQALTGVASS
jgi:hypothetical protein